MNNLKHISASSINAYNNCELNWYYTYVLKLLQLPNPAFIIGTLYHKCIEEFYKGGKVDLILDNIKKEILKDKPSDEDIKNYGLIRKMFKAYLLNPIDGDINDNEFRFSIRIPGVDVPLLGFIDRVDNDKIVEYKTTSQDFTLNDIKTLQSRIYVYAIYKEKGKILPVVYSINNKKKVDKKGYKPQVLSIEYSKSDLEATEDEIRTFYDKIGSQTSFRHKQGKYPCPFCHLKSEIKIK